MSDLINVTYERGTGGRIDVLCGVRLVTETDRFVIFQKDNDSRVKTIGSRFIISMEDT